LILEKIRGNESLGRHQEGEFLFCIAPVCCLVFNGFTVSGRAIEETWIKLSMAHTYHIL